MKRFFWVILMLMFSLSCHAQEEIRRTSQVEKILDLPGLFSRDGVLQESIGIETLAGIVTPILTAGMTFPAQVAIDFGVTPDCGCAKFRLFRISSNPVQPPVEISYDAIRGFSADNRKVTVNFEVTEKRKIKLTVPVAAEIPPGQLLEWVPAREIRTLPALVSAAGVSPVPASESVSTVETKAAEGAGDAAQSEFQIFKIAPARVNCVGAAPMQCFLIQREGKESQELFYESIQGFEYEEGFDYIVKVKVSPVENPPADASSLKYELAEVVQKTAVATKIEKELHDIWVLTDASLPSLKNSAPARLPVLELHVKEEAFMGQAPCNQYSGGFKAAEPQTIHFEQPAATRMACPDFDAENDYFKLLTSAETYRREGNELILSAGDLEVLRFKKVD